MVAHCGQDGGERRRRLPGVGDGCWAVQAGASSSEEVRFRLRWRAELPPEPGRAAAATAAGELGPAPAPREITGGRSGRPRKKTESAKVGFSVGQNIRERVEGPIWTVRTQPNG